MKRLAILAIIVCAWFHLAPAHAQFNGCSSFCGTSSSAIADAPGFNNAQNSGSGPALACTYTPVTSGTQNVAYTGATPSASGGVPAYTFSETGALPSGLTISSSTGVISGTPSVSGTFTGIQVKVTDTASTVANCGASFTLVISEAFSITSITPPTPQTVAASSFTFTGASIGTADTTRIVVVAVSHGVNSGITISSLTIGGNAATQVSGAATQSGAGSSTDIWALAVPTGTTANIVVNFSGSQSRVAISVYSVVGTGASVSTGAANQNANSTTEVQTATVPAGGGAIAVLTTHTATPGTITPTNLTTDQNTVFGGSSSIVGHTTSASGATSMGFSWVSTVDNALSIATFSP